MGSHALLTGRVAGQPMRVMAPPDTDARPGDTLHLRPDPARIVWMDATTGETIPA
jgi:multiple sugar transport system ATP-binding protein